MANIYDMVDTWTDSGTTYTAIKMDVSDTASAAGSLLIDLKVGGVTQFSVAKDGSMTGGAITNWNTAYSWGDHASAGYLTSATAATTYLPLSGGTLTGGLIGTTGTFSGAVTQEGNTVLDTADVGVSVQAYDADTAKLDVAQTYTAAQRGTVTTDNDLSFDMSATNFFKCTPTGNGTLTFTNITAGQSGNIWLDNSAAVVISAASTTYISAADLTKINSAGVYFLSYYSDGTNVMVSASSALTSAGA